MYCSGVLLACPEVLLMFSSLLLIFILLFEIVNSGFALRCSAKHNAVFTLGRNMISLITHPYPIF